MYVPIPTYVINLKDRIDRKNHILKEFEAKDEFNVNVVEARQHESGSMGLWNSIKYIIDELIDVNEDYVLICEDDHQFTDHYNKELLFTAIKLAIEQKADILIGGVSWFNNIFSFRKPLYWVESFNATQFIIIFNQSFEKILQSEFSVKDSADLKISELFNSKFLIYPFISIQKGFGYSDVTSRNANVEFLSQLFTDAEVSMRYILDGENFYRSALSEISEEENQEEYNDISIPTFVLSPNIIENKCVNIYDSFNKRNEFNIKLIEYDENKFGSNEQLLCLRKIIKSSIDAGDDVLIYCNSTEAFSDQYNKDAFIKCIIDAYRIGIDLIYGSDTGYFNHALPLTKHLLWVDHYTSLDFIIILKSIFFPILHEPIIDREPLENFISRLSTNKLLLFPSILQSKKSSLLKYRLQNIQDSFIRLC